MDAVGEHGAGVRDDGIGHRRRVERRRAGRHADAERVRGAVAAGRVGPGRVGHLAALGRGGGVDDNGQVDRDPEVAAQRVADRVAQAALDGVLGEVAGHGEQRGAVDQAQRTGEPEERALLGGERLELPIRPTPRRGRR